MGGIVPWELAADFASLWDAIESLALDPVGVLHREPERLLADDMRDTVMASADLLAGHAGFGAVDVPEGTDGTNRWIDAPAGPNRFHRLERPTPTDWIATDTSVT